MYVLTDGCYHSTDKGLPCTKMKKEILNCIEKYQFYELIELPLYLYRQNFCQ